MFTLRKHLLPLSMLSVSELQQLLKDVETDRIERTTSISNTDKFCQAICAFSNDFPNHNAPGYLIVGADDQGEPDGRTVTDQLLTNLADVRSPPPPPPPQRKYSSLTGNDRSEIQFARGRISGSRSLSQ